MRALLISTIAVFISGCAATYKHNAITEPDAKLVRGKSVVIATPSNGFYENKEYPSSGKMTANAIRNAFVRFTNSVSISPRCKDLDCIRNDRSRGYDYYVIPEILHWEDRATEWSGIPDRIEIKVSIYDSHSTRELASTIISGKSKWATFGGDHPQDLLPEPLGIYIGSLY